MQINRQILAAAALVAILPTMTISQSASAHSPGIGHTYFMRGSIVSDTNGQLVACVGRADNAKVGQQLAVYRTISSGGKNPLSFRRKQVGSVRVDEIINDHYASVSSTTSGIRNGDIVELARR